MKGNIKERNWYYDELTSWYEDELDSLKKFHKDIFNGKGRKIKAKSLEERIRQEALAGAAETSHRGYDLDLKLHRKRHVFLVGPATIDSLINEKPKTYEYVRDHKLPFYDLFFELFEPYQMPVPFIQAEKKLRAVGLFTGPDKGEIYGAKLYFDDGRNTRIEMGMGFDPVDHGKFFGHVNGVAPLRLQRQSKKKISSGINLFVMNLIDGRVTYFDSECSRRYLQTGAQEFGGRYSLDPEKLMQKMLELDKVKDMDRYKSEANRLYIKSKPLEGSEAETFCRAADLCTNLVNYINSHNVTYVERERSGRKKKRGKSLDKGQRIHLITVRDMALSKYAGRQEGESNRDYRSYVRGHNRIYKNPRYVVESAWVAPHTRGPKEAPFRDERHIVLYEKLRREQMMLQELGVKQA